MPLELRKARPEDFPALQQMLELYQYDLSDIYIQDTDAEASTYTTSTATNWTIDFTHMSHLRVLSTSASLS